MISILNDQAPLSASVRHKREQQQANVRKQGQIVLVLSSVLQEDFGLFILTPLDALFLSPSLRKGSSACRAAIFKVSLC